MDTSTKERNSLGLLTISLYVQHCTHFLDQRIFFESDAAGCFNRNVGRLAVKSCWCSAHYSYGILPRSSVILQIQFGIAAKLRVVSRSTCYYSENQSFCILKSWLLTWAHFFYEQNFLVCQDRKLKFCEVSWNSKS